MSVSTATNLRPMKALVWPVVKALVWPVVKALVWPVVTNDVKRGHWRRNSNISRLLKTSALGNYCESPGQNWWPLNKCTHLQTPTNNRWVMLDLANCDILVTWWDNLTTDWKHRDDRARRGVEKSWSAKNMSDWQHHGTD